MKKLFDETLRRFPEVEPYLSPGDEDLPYCVMNALAEWLKNVSFDALPPRLVQRVRSFASWCEDQPRSDNAGDDILTIFVVAFYESLFESELTQALIPELRSKQEYLSNAEYLKTWIGRENFEKVLKLYKN